MGFVIGIIVGAVSGWLAGQIMNTQFSMLGNIGVGVIGALCIFSAFYSRHKRRERMRKNMDIIEKAED